MRALVTGGTGFIGSNLARRLHELGHDVFLTGSPGEQDLSELRARMLPRDLSRLDWDALGRMDIVFHQAAITDTRVLDREEMFRVNVDAARTLFQAAAARGCRRIVYASSTAVYGDAPAPYREDVTPLRPLNPYGESKRALDEFAQTFAKAHPGVVVVGLRYCNVYGPGEAHKGPMASMVYQLAQQMRLGNPRIFRWGEQRRDYLYVADAVRANLRAAEAAASCIVNCGSGSATSFNDLVAILNEVLGLQRAPEYIDNPYADRYQSYTECDMALAKERIGFVPQFDLRSGIRAYAAGEALASGRLRPD